MKIKVKRAYDKAAAADGTRILVDRLWPRGVTKERARIDSWAKELAPSNELRKWLHENPAKNFRKFSALYKKELKEHKDEIQQIPKNSTLITAAKDLEHSHIPVLKKYIEENL